MATDVLLAPGVTDRERTIHERVAEFTRQIFGGPVVIRREPDPEVAIEYFVVYARISSSDVNKIVDLNRRWHAEIGGLAGEQADLYRLTFELA